MVSFKDTLFVIIFSVIIWIIFTVTIMLCIHASAFKKIERNSEKYPYFTYPFYKKIFLIGLKGVISPTVVVSTFLTNLFLIVVVFLGIWNLISANIIVSHIFIVGFVAYGVSFLVRSGSFGLSGLRFK